MNQKDSKDKKVPKNFTSEVIDADFSKKNDSQINQQIISKLIHTSDPFLPIENERKNMLIKSQLPKICYISFYPNKIENYLIPIMLYFTEKPLPSLLSYFAIPNDPYTIYFECSEPTILLQNLNLIPQIAEMSELSIQPVEDEDFIRFFCNFIILCYIKVGNFVKVSNPEFEGDFGQIISVDFNKKKCLLKLMPRIDYDNLEKNHLTEQTKLNDKMPVEYRPPKSFFEKERLSQIDDKVKFETETIKIENDIELELTNWDGKQFYGLFQYKCFKFDEIKTINEKVTFEEQDIFQSNVYLNENKIKGLENQTDNESENENQSDDEKRNFDDENEEEEINPVIQDEENNESILEEQKEENENENSSILSDIPKRFPQVSILTNYITLKVPQENFVWLEKTDGLHTNIIIENNKAYSISNGKAEIMQDLELNGPEFVKRTILDTEFYNDKYYVFDAAMIEGEDISENFFRERMALAQQFIEKTKVSYFIIKEYYDLTSWKELIQFVEKNYISPFTGNRIDGVVCQRTDKHYYCTVNDPGCFKLKRKVMITNDFYVRYQENEKRFYLYLNGNYKNYIFNLKQIPKNNKYMKKHTDVDPNVRELPKNFYILFASPYMDYLHVFKPRIHWLKNGYFEENIKEIESLMNEIIRNPMAFDKKIIEMSLADDGWVPMRIRNDKVTSNRYIFGITNTSIIFSPVTGEESYFSKKFFFDTTIIDTYHKVNQIMRKYIIEHSINRLNNPRLNVLDLAGGRGADLLSLFHSGAYNIFAVDADRNALVQYVSRSNNLANMKWEKLRSSSVDFAKNRKTFSLNAVYAMLGKNNTRFIADIKSRYEYPEGGFDVILMNYAIHYLCYNHQCIRELNRFIHSLLAPGGLFIFSCFDGDLILRDMKKNVDTNEFELNLNSFNIKLLNDLSDVEFGHQSDRDAMWANMALPTIDASGYRPEPLVQRKWLNDLRLRILEHYYPLKKCERYLNDIENKEKVVDYLKYIQVYVMEN